MNQEKQEEEEEVSYGLKIRQKRAKACQDPDEAQSTMRARLLQWWQVYYKGSIFQMTRVDQFLTRVDQFLR